MSKRDAEIVNDYKHIFASMFSSPHLREVPGTWYVYECDGHEPWIALCNEGESPLDQLNPEVHDQWTVTPLLIYKVDADKLR